MLNTIIFLNSALRALIDELHTVTTQMGGTNQATLLKQHICYLMMTEMFNLFTCSYFIELILEHLVCFLSFIVSFIMCLED